MHQPQNLPSQFSCCFVSNVDQPAAAKRSGIGSQLRQESRGKGSKPGPDRCARSRHSGPVEFCRYLQPACFAIQLSKLCENYLLAILETYGSGAIEVRSNPASALELVMSNQAGLLFEPCNAEELVDKVSELISAAKWRLRLADGEVNKLRGATRSRLTRRDPRGL